MHASKKCEPECMRVMERDEAQERELEREQERESDREMFTERMFMKKVWSYKVSTFFLRVH